MKAVKNRSSVKANIPLQRKLWMYYGRLIIMLKLTIILFIIVFFSTNIFNKYKIIAQDKFLHLSADCGLVLENVVIEGQKNTPLKEIIDVIGADKGAPIFSIDIKTLKEKLEENFWIKTAIVERRLPNTIYIGIVEQNPIAIWQFEQKLYIIDSEGRRISAYNGEKFSNLLQVVGSDANIYASNLIDELNKYPNLASKVASAVRYGQRRWNLNFKDNITVKMPESHFASAYEFLSSLDKNNKLFDQSYKMIDLRDPTKYYTEKYKEEVLKP